MVPGDIPLKSLAHYAPLEDDHSTRSSMSAARATASPNRSRILKRGSRYTEIPDDQEHLLADPSVGEDFGDHDSEILVSSRDAVKGVNARMVRNITFSDRSRTIPFRPLERFQSKFPANVVRNQKYNFATFLPLVFYEQFKFFFNLYFLLVALSQFVPALKIGFIVTYVAPLAFVLAVTMGKEAYDDYKRFQRDREANSQTYRVLDTSSHPTSVTPETPGPLTRATPSSSLRKNQRVPADLVLLRTSDSSGTCFIRTDQLDGETDWKLRVAVPACQALGTDNELLDLDAEIYADAPMKDINSFVGTFSLQPSPLVENSENPETRAGTDVPLLPKVVPLTVENMLWSNTVLAAGMAIGFVIYTGSETRAVMNTSHPETKVGLLDIEINRLAKILCTVTFALSVALVAMNGFRGLWYVYIFRFLILFSSIIPISLRVNLDMGKTYLPEELGRIEYLLSDKTGTLTQNEMEMKKLHMGTMSFGYDSMDEVSHQLAMAFGNVSDLGRRGMTTRLRDIVMSLALCHNVTPVCNDDHTVTYQASSPDEVAIVKWTESVGLTLVYRDRARIDLRIPSGSVISFDVLQIFPFTSETKRMGIIVRDNQSGEIMFLEKGADVVMAGIVQRNDWLEEECANMAREGLRTLVVARRKLSPDAYNTFRWNYDQASVSLHGRNEAMTAVIGKDLEQEDKLQDEVRSTLELLRNAGLKIWMLTGDKIETATVIAISTKLVARNQYIHTVSKLTTADEVRMELELLQSKPDCCLVIDGTSLQLCLDLFESEFIEITTKLPAVVACRCSPTQKADVARLIRRFTKKRVCCIGDGGNDVSMIQAANIGVGIVGKEGKQASLAADFSVTQFSHLTKLLLWHGRNSYKRSAKLAQFVIHRGLIISIMQAVFSAIFYFAPIALYQGWLMVGYATIYTMAPVFSLVLDRDVSEDLALIYPELYKELTKGRALSYKTFFIWVMISLYQGGAIMIMSLLLFENEFLNIVAISFTALVLNELIMVMLEITTWHVYMGASLVVTLLFYIVSIAFLPEYFDLAFVVSERFAWKVALIVAVSSLPLYIIKLIKGRINPATFTKLL
ncbi:hypothetical protein BS47DRAFT_1372504 [Hydnum rufescens UP504]|uniref:Phospholipid-transporting ATPase n=1 Tax=Hydnum rufescens UP504 TaxID=1448309 RepID=A0A9P6DSR5_9AGAM|nr:hypothetical protein BS47DRAFT_1372504 [Hydnum rufescens UP504]